MRVMGFCGCSGSGKMTLLARLIPLFVAKGLTVSTIKHARRDFEIDKPGKDSWVHRKAGAREVLVAAARRFALVHEVEGAREPALGELLARMAPVDLVLIEGFKRDVHPKIEVYRPELGKTLLSPGDPAIAGVASPGPPPDIMVSWLPLDAPEVVADFILREAWV